MPDWLDPSRLHVGGDWLLDAEAPRDPVWGYGDEILWHTGEALLVVGPTGVGKTTLTIQLILALMGLRSNYVLGYPINGEPRRVLYLAGDRPEQFRRAMLRNVDESDRGALNKFLTVWRGPTPRDLARYPDTLTEMCQETEADTVIVDSLKDAALRLSDDDTGSGLHRAINLTLVNGTEVLGLHHQRKGQEGRKPTTIEDVYGSTWIVNGMGSVLLLWGDPGSQIVEMTHLKQPAGIVGPYTLEHDHLLGHTHVLKGRVDILAMVEPGSTVLDVARRLYAVLEPSDSQRRVTQRKLDAMVPGQLQRMGTVNPVGGRPVYHYYPLPPKDTSMDTGVVDTSMDSNGQPSSE